MGELNNRRGLESHREEVHHLVANGVGIEVHAHGVLHPRVSHQNPPSRNHRAQRSEPCSGKVRPFAHFLPTEEHDGNESGFHEECENPLNSKRCSEDVAYEPRVVRPVSAKLKLKDDTRSNANGKVDTEQFLPETGNAPPSLIAFDDINGLHDRHHHAQAEREGNEKPVVTGSKRKLQAREK